MQMSRLHLFATSRCSKGVAVLPYLTCEHLISSECWYSTSGDGEGINANKNIRKVGDKEIELPPPPTTCCMSGCQNCVWLVYAEDLKKTLCSSSEENMKIILDQIEDPNMKAFLKFELSHMEGDAMYRPTCPEHHDS